MIISLNWLKKYTKIEKSIDELKLLIDSRLVEVESIKDLKEKYKDVLIAKVISFEPLPNSKHLSLVHIDDGGVFKHVERDDKSLIQVVCGASNVRENMFVAWLPPESIVPISFGQVDEFKLSVKKILGQVSNGMLASAKELGLSEDHSGILEIHKTVKAGDSFTEVYELEDLLFEIENKSLTHRPDTFGIIGFAREVSAIQGIKFNTPNFMMDTNYEKYSGEEKISIEINPQSLSSQYSAVVLSDADAKLESPDEVKNYLNKIGVRSINAIVDVTNYLMMLTGQPLHTFDYDKIKNLAGENPKITIRNAKNGEKTILIDGKELELTTQDIVIDAGGVVIGLAGAMGSKNTAVDKDTKNILLESATFSLYNLRSTQMRHGIFSEAITRFTKGQPSGLGLPVLYEAIKLLEKWSNARVVSEVFVAKGYDDSNKKINIDIEFINQTLGTLLEKKEIIKILENAEFNIIDKGGTIEVLAPFWRTDIKIAEDIVDEVGRVYGFDNITPSLPKRKITPIATPDLYDFKNKIRNHLKSVGANEMYLYSFVHGNTLSKNNQNADNSYKIINAISPELQYYRQNLVPSLLSTVYSNIKQGFDNFAIYEINKVHFKQHGLNKEKVPVEDEMIGFVFASKLSNSSAYYYAKRYLNFICTNFNITYKLEGLVNDPKHPASMIFDPNRSAKIKSGSRLIGFIGEFMPEIIASNKLPKSTSGFEIDLEALFQSIDKNVKNYRQLSKYPKTSRDICFQVDAKLPYEELLSCLNKVKDSLDIYTTVSLVDIYRPNESRTKNITVQIVYEPHNKTLTTDEANSISQKFIDSSQKALKVIVI